MSKLVLEEIADQAIHVSIPTEDSKEYQAMVSIVQSDIVRKFAYSAQHGGMVYKMAPNSSSPLKDKDFNRISRAGHSFHFRDKRGKSKRFFLRADEILAALDDPELDFGFTIVERVDFRPGEELITNDGLGRTCLNLWHRPEWVVGPTSETPSVFVEHLSYLADGDESTVNHLLDFLAHLVQHPEQRVNHAILITSEAKGIGKSTLGTAMQRLVGATNAGVVQSKDLKGTFDGWLAGKLVIQVDEVYEYGNWDLANRLKPIITEPLVSVNIKYGPQCILDNFARLIMFSNHPAPIDLEEGDRRYFVVNSRATPREPEYYERLYAFIDSRDGMSNLYGWLMKRDITNFKPFAPPPVTADKSRLIAASGNPVRRYIEESILSGWLHSNIGREFTYDALERQLVKDGYGQHAKNYKEVGAALDAAGVTKVRRTGDGSRCRMFRLPEPSVSTAVDVDHNDF